MLRSNTINYMRQLISVFGYEEANRKALTKGFLMLGGATDLQKGEAGWYCRRPEWDIGKKTSFLVPDIL